MTLKELQKMIKEEFDAYVGEAEDEVDVAVTDNDVDAEMGDEEMPDMDDAEDEEETDLDENATTSAQYQKTGFAAGGAGKGGTGYDAGSVGGKGSTGYDVGSKALQERFQKLANIIK